MRLGMTNKHASWVLPKLVYVWRKISTLTGYGYGHEKYLTFSIEYGDEDLYIHHVPVLVLVLV